METENITAIVSLIIQFYNRLFKFLGQKMWNFTVHGLLAPCLSEIEHLFKSSETVKKPQ